MSKRTKFAKIYDKFVDKIFRFIFFKVESKETAEDLTSEVFLRVWEIYQKKEIENIRAFLYQTARNLLVDHYRKREKDNHVSLDSLYPLADQKESLEEKIEKNWKLEFVKNRLKNLREEYQEALFLRYVDGYSIKEIAEIMGKTPQNTKVLLHRALEALKKECNLPSGFSSS